MMKVKMMSFHLRCPWCEGSETLADGKGKVTISVQCPKCKHIYKADLDTGKTEKSKAQMRLKNRR